MTRTALWLLAVLASAVPAPRRVGAQLRPHDPIPWEAVGAEGPMARVGMGIHWGARATLAGTRGTLLELGNVLGTWSFGRVALEVGGTAVRVFSDDSVYASPVAGARAPNGERRVDTGEQRLGTIVLVTPSSSPVEAVLRFGTRLPTTDNGQGLGRDQTDFYGTVGGRLRPGALEITAEAGVGIMGTRLERPEQMDALLYAAGVGWRGGRGGVRLEAVGQHDTRRSAALRGLEDLSEARLTGEVGGARWVRATVLRGLTLASPDFGVTIEAGTRF